MDPKDPRMKKFKVDLLGMDISGKEFRADELTKRYGFNPTQSRKICNRLNEAVKRALMGESTTAVKPVSGPDESNDGDTEDTTDFATAAPGSRTVTK